MSTLCRAKWQLRNVRGARPIYRAATARRRTRSQCGASRPAIPVKDVFGGTPNTARETHALPTHLSALLNDPQGNQTERVHGFHSSPECIRGSSDDFFCPRRIRPFFAPFALCDFAFNSSINNPTPSHRVAVSRSDFVKGTVKVSRPFYLRSVKPSQSQSNQFGFDGVSPYRGKLYANTLS
jgi:hypothetical protein